MFTPLPHPDFRRTADVLGPGELSDAFDDAIQTMTVLLNPDEFRPTPMWRSPGVVMWNGYTAALAGYTATIHHAMPAKARQANAQAMNRTWARIDTVDWVHTLSARLTAPAVPWWFGWPEFHLSHQLKLIRTSRIFFTEKFGRDKWRFEDMPVVWPVGKIPGSYRTREPGKHGKWSDYLETDYRANDSLGVSCHTW